MTPLPFPERVPEPLGPELRLPLLSLLHQVRAAEQSVRRGTRGEGFVDVVQRLQPAEENVRRLACDTRVPPQLAARLLTLGDELSMGLRAVTMLRSLELESSASGVLLRSLSAVRLGLSDVVAPPKPDERRRGRRTEERPPTLPTRP